MNYTFQEISASGSFAGPPGDLVCHAHSKAQLETALDLWTLIHRELGSDPQDASLHVWKGIYADVTDVYPEWIVFRGPQGGFRMDPA